MGALSARQSVAALVLSDFRRNSGKLADLRNISLDDLAELERDKQLFPFRTPKSFCDGQAARWPLAASILPTQNLAKQHRKEKLRDPMDSTSNTGIHPQTFRIYFNRWNDAPLIWSVDEGSQATERIVREVRFDNVSGVTRTGPGDNVKSPTVWIEVEGRLSIADEIATFRPARQTLRMPKSRAA